MLAIRNCVVRPQSFDAANDTKAPDWTAHPFVRRLLASFAKTPAPEVELRTAERWDHRGTAYAGFRVECLRILRTSILESAFRAAERRGDTDAARAIAAAPSVSAAIDGARRIPTLRPIAATVRQLDPAIWGAAL